MRSLLSKSFLDLLPDGFVHDCLLLTGIPDLAVPNFTGHRPPESTPARRERSRKKAAGLSGSDPLLIMRGFARAGF